MKLSNYIKKFEDLDKEDMANGKNVLTADQSFIFKDVLKQYSTNKRYGVLDAKSGSGKTTLIRALIKYAETNSITINVTASTGKAASALGGKTIHSYLGLKMVQNDDAENVEDALKLSSQSEEVEMVDILIIDEASMIGQKVFSSIDSERFNFVLFVMDSSQLPPVKEKKVDWSGITDLQYTLSKTLRAKDPKLTQLFEDFREYKNGNIESLDLMSYVNGDNIVAIDYADCDGIPVNSECCSVAYRNKLVEFLVGEWADDKHNLYNLNAGISVTRMVATQDVPNGKGYFKREFVEQQLFYNGEDVFIDKLVNETEAIVSNGYVYHNGYKLSMNQNKTGITISAHKDCVIPYNAKEPHEDKHWLQFPPEKVLEKCTLVCVEGKNYILLWDGTESEYNDVLDYYFMQLQPYLKTMQIIKGYHKGKDVDVQKLPLDIRTKLTTETKEYFMGWFNDHAESYDRKARWRDFLSAKSVASARKTVSRTIHKSQGISVPAVVVTDSSFYGASKDAQYVAITRMKRGLILVTNTPDTWKGEDAEEDVFE